MGGEEGLQQRGWRAGCRRAAASGSRWRHGARRGYASRNGDSTGGRWTRDRPAASSSDAAPDTASVAVPDQRKGAGRRRRTVPSLRRCSCGQRRRDVPNARIGVGQGCAAAGAFLPAGARFSDLIAVNDMVYTATSQGCGGAANGIWAINASSDTKAVVSWKTNGGNPIGSVAFATNGTAIVAIGPGTVTAGGYANAIVALDPKTLALKDWFTQPGVEFVAPPVLFQDGGKDIVAVTTKDGRILLLDAAALGGANHATPLFASASLTGGAAIFAAQSPAMWQERATSPSSSSATAPPAAAAPAAASEPQAIDGARWLLVPVAGRLPANLGAAANGAVSTGTILAVRIAHQAGTFSVQPAWMSQNIAAPLTPIVINGVVFAASGPANAPATLYALNGATGTTLWQSGTTIGSPLSGRSLWAGSGHVFVGTRDGTVYAFGFAMERH